MDMTGGRVTSILFLLKNHEPIAPISVASVPNITSGSMQPVPHAEEAFGFSFEKILLFAETMGLGSTWIAGTMDRPAFEKAMELKEGEVMPCISPLGYPAKKLSIREAMMRKGVGADKRMPAEKLFFDGSFDKPLDSAAQEKIADLIDVR